jgi:hypothetical protein
MEIKKVWAALNRPGKKDEPAGFILISLQILSKNEASAN